jgi:hypothetical protein
MPSTYTDNGGIEKIGLGEKAGAWGTTTNNNFDIIDRLTNGVGAITLSGTTHTLTTSDGSLSDGMFKVLVLGGSPSGTNTITISPNDADKLYFVQNGTSQTATFTQGSGANASVSAGEAAIIFADGAGSGAAVTDLSALLPLKSGVAGSFTTVTASTSLLPDSSGGADIGSTSLEWGDIYIADDKKIKFGSDQDISMEYDEDGTDSLLISGGDVTIADDKKLFFGTDKDVSIEYDEDGNNTMLVTGDVVFADGSTSVDIKSHDLSANGLKLDGTLITASAAEINKLDGVTRTTSEINSARDGTVTSVATGSGLTGGTITSSGTLSLKNSFLSNTSSAISSNSSGVTSFTASTYPTFISGRTVSSGGGAFTVTVGGQSHTLSMQDGDGGTFDVFATLLPAGATISGNSFIYVAVQLRPG